MGNSKVLEGSIFRKLKSSAGQSVENTKKKGHLKYEF
jgi:hypothetical protein